MIIGITGTLGAGKGTIVSYLVKNKDFKHYSVREFLTKEVRERGLELNRDNLVLVANQLREMHSPRYIVEKLYEKAELESENSIIESIRTPAEADLIKEKRGYLIAVDTPPKIRYSRILRRQSETDNISYDEFLDNEKREMFSTDPNKQNLSECIKKADFIINNKTIEILNKTIGDLFLKLKKLEEQNFETKTIPAKTNYTSSEETQNSRISKTKQEGSYFFEKDTGQKEKTTEKRCKKRTDYISWEEYFMSVAVLSAMRSKDPNTQVGACIVNQKNHIVAAGYNGFPIGCNDDELPWSREGEKLETKYPYVVHAEQNAITNATTSLDNCKIYLPLFPCNECAKLIIQSGINEVIYISDKYSEVDEFKAAKKMLNISGIKLKQYTPKNEKLILDFNKLI